MEVHIVSKHSIKIFTDTYMMRMMCWIFLASNEQLRLLSKAPVAANSNICIEQEISQYNREHFKGL